MSTDYCSSKKILMSDLFDGRLQTFNIREQQSEITSAKRRCLTDEFNYVWAYSDQDGNVVCLTRYNSNNPNFILECISIVFDTEVFSEHEPQYWGFNSKEEWRAAEAQATKESDEEFYRELLKFFADEPCNIRPGTIGWECAKIAKKLVADNPELKLESNRDALLKQSEEIHRNNRSA
jgi:hypothetical protein